jgi:choline monooxygenase
MQKFIINPDITKAETLPASFYKDEEVFDAIRERVFVKTWQWIGDDDLVPLVQQVYPFTLLDSYLNEPLLLTKNENGEIFCLSNVCTHRGNLVVHHPGKAKKLQCMYHGRRFGLNGEFEFMPEFKEAKDFPRTCENLPQFPIRKWGPFLFAGLEPAFDLGPVLDKMNERVGFLPFEEFKFEKSLSKDYLVHAHWALYCDNYLEGFHIPFVHEDLNKALDYGSYTTELFDYFNLQIGYSSGGEDVFELPEGHPDYGKSVSAYYYWVFPNMMFNFYPWGLSINIVQPLALDRTKVSFLTYVLDKQKLNRGAGALLDKVEREDEFVVEGVQKGVNSRFYKAGRFSPKMEKGVHHFHQLLVRFLNE